MLQSSFFPREHFSKGVMLDLGCGTCENTKWFGQKVGANMIVGLDWNKNFLQYATEQGVPEDWDCKLVLCQENLNHPDWHMAPPAVEYDLITSFLTVHWVKNLTNCFKGLKHLMTPGRTLMYHVIGIRPGQNFQATIKTLASTEKWGPIIQAFMHATRWQDPTIADWRTAPDPAAAFRDILSAAGFSVSVCAKMAFTYVTESEQECRGHLKWLVPFMAELPPGEQAALMDDFMSVYGQFTRQEGPGRYVWENEVLVVLATRDIAAVEDTEGHASAGCQ